MQRFRALKLPLHELPKVSLVSSPSEQGRYPNEIKTDRIVLDSASPREFMTENMSTRQVPELSKEHMISIAQERGVQGEAQTERKLKAGTPRHTMVEVKRNFDYTLTYQHNTV